MYKIKLCAMVSSMTGFGKAFIQLPTKKITIEIKTLNSKNLDLFVRTPQLYKEKELLIRSEVAKMLERGKVEVSLHVEITGKQTNTAINKPIVDYYINQLKEISPNADAVELLKMAIKMPDVLKTSVEDLDEEEWAEIEKLLKQAIFNTIEFRQQEGMKMQLDIHQRIKSIQDLLTEIEAYESTRIEHVKSRLQTQLQALEVSVDEQRFAQEVIYYIEKLDINEEKIRLISHLDYFKETLDSPLNTGKKLGFIAQEIGREVNTMGSKSNQAEMQQIVVKMKDDLEKIKEQVLNIL